MGVDCRYITLTLDLVEAYSNVTNVIRDFINNELLNSPNLTSSTSELLYTFDIPLSSLDISGSYLHRYF